MRVPRKLRFRGTFGRAAAWEALLRLVSRGLRSIAQTLRGLRPLQGKPRITRLRLKVNLCLPHLYSTLISKPQEKGLGLGFTSTCIIDLRTHGDIRQTGKMLAFVFPGQGSQKVGMGQDFAESSPAARAVFEEIDDTLGEHLSRLIFTGEPAELERTENAQPALYAMSLAVVRACEEALGGSLADYGAYAAGHSLGEYTALAFAGALSPSDGAKLLRIRARAMQQATPLGVGGMVAVLGLSRAGCELVAVQAASRAEQEAGTSQVCVVANDNSGTQVVLSGHAGALALVPDLAKEQGARRVVPLAVSAPFHSPLMQPAADRMQEALADIPWKPLVVPVVSNVTATPEADVAAFRELLVRQITGQVRWRETMEFFAGAVSGVVELGVGTVLSGLVRKSHPGLKASSVATWEAIESFLRQLEDNRV